MGHVAVGLLVFVAAVVAVSGGSAAATFTDRVVGAEYPPITATVGTFAGVAGGPVPGRWRVQIVHQPLHGAASVAITGGSFTMRTLSGRRLSAAVTGGSVVPVDVGTGCANQTYTVDAALTAGSFAGTLIHHRRRVFGRCVLYAATISGHASLTS